MIAVFTGSFNPLTEGHLHVIKRAAKMFDTLYVAVLINPDKVIVASLEEREELIRKKTKDIDNVVATSYNGYAVDLCKKLGVDYIVRGIRDVTDYNYEREMAQYNFAHSGINTVYLIADAGLKTISSTKVKQQ
jgi:pantetheine-phosphate adenylyltransferase